MTNSKTLFTELTASVTLQDSDAEIKDIVFLLLEKVLCVSRADVAAGKTIALPHEQRENLYRMVGRINAEEPVQYILGESEFFGRTFHVNRNVLIPRPETEELVSAALASVVALDSPRIADIGTGSGCIAVTLSLERPDARVFATDVSEEALSVARGNASALGAHVTFARADILTGEIPFAVDMIVSNPPYVTPQEASVMRRNVLDYEPHLALFAPAGDPLAFYRAILGRSHHAVSPGGTVIVEINEHHGDAVAGLFRSHDLAGVEIRTDSSGKNRIVRGMISG